MSKTKEFPTLIVASALTGIGLCKSSFDEIQEIADHLLGYEIWTHELMNDEIKDAYRAEGFKQFPQMPTRQEALEDWQVAAAQAILTYGETVNVVRGDHKRTKGPVQNFADQIAKAIQ